MSLCLLVGSLVAYVMYVYDDVDNAVFMVMCWILIHNFHSNNNVFHTLDSFGTNLE